MQPVHRNPVHDYLEKQQREVTERISSTKSEIEKIRKVTGRLQRSLFYRSVYGIDPNPDSEDDIYTAAGCPIQLQKQPQNEKRDVLTAVKRWQHIIDDKWVLGVVLRNVSKEREITAGAICCSKLEADAEIPPLGKGLERIWENICLYEF